MKYTDKLIGLIEKYGLARFDEEVLEVVEKDEIIVKRKDGSSEKIRLDMIRKDGHVYPYLRGLAEPLGYRISSQGRVPVLIEE